MSRRQCAKCPWKASSDPRDIPNGYCELKHIALKRTIAVPGELSLEEPLRIFACHQSKLGKEIPCVGWLDNQLGSGSNILLRLAVLMKHVDTNYKLVGKQHARFEDTLPRDL